VELPAETESEPEPPEPLLAEPEPASELDPDDPWPPEPEAAPDPESESLPDLETDWDLEPEPASAAFLGGTLAISTALLVSSPFFSLSPELELAFSTDMPGIVAVAGVFSSTSGLEDDLVFLLGTDEVGVVLSLEASDFLLAELVLLVVALRVELLRSRIARVFTSTKYKIAAQGPTSMIRITTALKPCQ